MGTQEDLLNMQHLKNVMEAHEFSNWRVRFLLIQQLASSGSNTQINKIEGSVVFSNLALGICLCCFPYSLLVMLIKNPSKFEGKTSVRRVTNNLKACFKFTTGHQIVKTVSQVTNFYSALYKKKCSNAYLALTVRKRGEQRCNQKKITPIVFCSGFPSMCHFILHLVFL